MYGVAFDGHPSLRHLYLPSEFEGHPLRKDYPLLARIVKPWPGLVDVEAMPGEEAPNGAQGDVADVTPAAPSAEADASAEADKGEGDGS
jgi:NADH-quinone oxidoreductase subunit C